MQGKHLFAIDENINCEVHPYVPLKDYIRGEGPCITEPGANPKYDPGPDRIEVGVRGMGRAIDTGRRDAVRKRAQDTYTVETYFSTLRPDV